MSEKFDFSKIEDQKKFEELPKEKRKEIIDETEEEAHEINKKENFKQEIRETERKNLELKPTFEFIVGKQNVNP